MSAAMTDGPFLSTARQRFVLRPLASLGQWTLIISRQGCGDGGERHHSRKAPS